jgi:hypothetical protein
MSFLKSRTVLVEDATTGATTRFFADPDDKSAFLGAGGEAAVYRFGNNKALKLFHRNEDLDPARTSDEKKTHKLALQLKERKVLAFPKNMPEGVLAPIDFVKDTTGKIVGYTMPLLGGMFPIYKLSDFKERTTLGVQHDHVVTFLRDLHSILVKLHALRVIVGDLNDGNEMCAVHPQPVIRVIDVDSMQFNGLPCVVAAPRFLDPRFYNKDVAGLFNTDTDWYAFTALLFQSLLCVLPFGGVHKKHRGYLRRAENRISILHPDVKYNGVIPPDRLPDDLVHHFIKVFEQDLRGVFPESLLQIQWTKCLKCGEEHARNVCPKCAAPGLVVEAIRYNKACKSTRVFETRGVIRHLRVQNGRIQIVYEENGNVYRQDGKKVWDSTPPPNTRFSVQGRSTWIGAGNGTLLQIEDETLKQRTSTDVSGTLPVFDSSSSAIYRIEGLYLYRNTQVLGSVLPGHTWVKAGESLGIAVSQAANTWFHQIFFPSKIGLIPVGIPQPQGKVRDVDAVFSDQHVLFSRAEERNGQIIHVMVLVDVHGQVVAQTEGDPDQVRMLRSVKGKCVFGGKILCPTSEGLLLLKTDQGAIVEEKLFVDTAPFVNDGDSVFVSGPTAVWVANNKTVWLVEIA